VSPRDTCATCRRPLTDPVSRERGRGPKCAADHAGVRHVVRVAATRRQLRRRLPEDQPLPGFPTEPRHRKTA
jgi:hypothetical protein